MQTPLVTLSTGPVAPNRPFAVGDLVVNFGVGARVIAVCDNGDLILRETGLNVPQPAIKWRADAAKCQAAY